MDPNSRKAKLNLIMDVIGECTETCGDVEVKISKDRVVVLNCPPVVVAKLTRTLTSYDVCIALGGLAISLR